MQQVCFSYRQKPQIAQEFTSFSFGGVNVASSFSSRQKLVIFETVYLWNVKWPWTPSKSDMQAQLPRGINQIRPHLEGVDNVPLLVNLFTDCTAASESVDAVCLEHDLIHALTLKTKNWKGGSQDGLLVKHQVHDGKVASSSSGWRGRTIFISRVNFLCRLLFWCPFHSVLPQWYVKDPSHTAKSAGGKLHLNMRTLITQRSWSGLTVPSRHSVGTYQGKQADTWLIRKHLATVISAHWAIVYWSRP